MKSELYQQLEAFTCIMYGYPHDTILNEVMALMVGEDERNTSKFMVELSMFLHCAHSHGPH